MRLTNSTFNQSALAQTRPGSRILNLASLPVASPGESSSSKRGSASSYAQIATLDSGGAHAAARRPHFSSSCWLARSCFSIPKQTQCLHPVRFAQAKCHHFLLDFSLIHAIFAFVDTCAAPYAIISRFRLLRRASFQP